MANLIGDRVRWTVTDGDETHHITTEGSMTWVLQTLLVAGSHGLHPIDTEGGRWASKVARLRGMGVRIKDRHAGGNGRLGYALACTVTRSEVIEK